MNSSKFNPFVLGLSLGVVLTLAGVVIVAKTATWTLLFGLVATAIGCGLIFVTAKKLLGR